MSYHNLLFMDFKVPPIWPLPPSSNWSPTPSPSCPPPPTTWHKLFPASRHPHFLLPHPKHWWFPPSFNSDLYSNITSERYPLNTSLALFVSLYPTTSITTTWNFILTHVFIISTKVSECKFSKGSDLNHGAYCCAPLPDLFATIYWINSTPILWYSHISQALKQANMDSWAITPQN